MKVPLNLLINTDIINLYQLYICTFLCKNKDDINHSSAVMMFNFSKMTSKVKAIKITSNKSSIYAQLREIKREGEIERLYPHIINGEARGRGVDMTLWGLGLLCTMYCICMLTVFLRVRNNVWSEWEELGTYKPFWFRKLCFYRQKE